MKQGFESGSCKEGIKKKSRCWPQPNTQDPFLKKTTCTTACVRKEAWLWLGDWGYHTDYVEPSPIPILKILHSNMELYFKYQLQRNILQIVILLFGFLLECYIFLQKSLCRWLLEGWLKSWTENAFRCLALHVFILYFLYHNVVSNCSLKLCTKDIAT